MNPKEKRIVRGYKCPETPYRKAMRRAKKEKTTLAAKIERMVYMYAQGAEVEYKISPRITAKIDV